MLRLASFSIGLCVLNLLAPSFARAERPNIVVILSDDHGYADSGFMGSTEVRTPNLDKLARSGAVLESFYVQPVCSPTRSSLMTGRYVSRTGMYHVVRPSARWGLPLAERTLANALHEAGYQTAICGKWHLGDFEPAYRPTRRGFDLQYGHWYGAIDYFTHLRDGILDWHRNDAPSKDEGYSTQLIADEACRIIRSKKQDQPLFLYVPFNAVHGPYQAPEKYTQQFEHLQGTRRVYAGMLAAMDEAVGRIVEALQEKGMSENTIILFSSDNGGPSPGQITSNGPLRAGKGTIYEGGIRACAFATWPGHIPSGARIAEPMHIIDWYPTLVKLAGGSLEQELPIDGRDVWPVLTKGARSPHEDLYLPGMSPQQAAIRKGDWKLLVNAGAVRGEVGGKQSIELYNLAKDVGETKNVADEHPEVVEELRKLLAARLETAVEPGDAKLTPDERWPTEKKAGAPKKAKKGQRAKKS